LEFGKIYHQCAIFTYFSIFAFIICDIFTYTSLYLKPFWVSPSNLHIAETAPIYVRYDSHHFKV